MKDKVYYIIGFLFLFSCNTKKEVQNEKAAPPNILFILTDDMTYNAIKALGNDEIYTPNLDRMAASGTTFTHAYNMGGWAPAICMASRAMIISGRSLWNANLYRGNWPNGKELNLTWGKLMEKKGYSTYFSGKWHVDAPVDSVFQTVAHERPGMPVDAWILRKSKQDHENSKTGTSQSVKDLPGYNRPLSKQDSTWSSTDMGFGGYWEGGTHWSEILREDAISFISDAENSEAPFFMYLSFNAPHDPRQAPKKFLDLYPMDQISLPKSWLPQYPHAQGIGSGQGVRDEDLAPFPRRPYATLKHIQEYYALVSHMDHQIGLILDRLEKSSKKDNTYIIFTADHGLAIGNHGLLRKQNMFGHSTRVPFIMVGPDIPKGKSLSLDIYLQDAMPTSLELAGIPKPKHIFFNSVLDLAKGVKTKSNYDHIYGAYMDTQRMVRKDGFKLIVYPKIKKMLLFDLGKDPHEMNDLAKDTRYAGKLDSLFLDLQGLQLQFNDTLPLIASDYVEVLP